MERLRHSPRTTTGRLLLAGCVLVGASCASSQDPAASSDESLPPTEAATAEATGSDVLVSIDEAANATELADRYPVSTPTTEPPVDTDLTVTATIDPDNALIARVSVDASVDARVELTIEASGIDTRVLVSEPGESNDFTVIGLRASTDYTFTAAVTADQATGQDLVTSGALPITPPAVSASATLDSTSSGITFFGIPPATGDRTATGEYFGIDEAGEVVWYLDSDQTSNRDPMVRSLGNGELLAFFSESMQRLSLDGTVLQSYDMSAVDGWHHDAVLLDNGGVLALSRENRTINGTDVRGDVIVELNAAGTVVWEWSTFDYLDTTRFPGALANAEAVAGGLDWTHANSVFIDETTNEILLSLRSQNWIVNIDRASGSLNWIAGDDDQTSTALGGSVLSLTSGTWTSGQHAATWTESGELLAYDNRNETGGAASNSRIVTYDIDTGASTATQTFEALAPKFTRSLGDVDELDNGNFLMTAGGPGSSSTAHLVEVDRAGNTVWEATLDERVYRSERIAWDDVEASTGEPVVPPAPTGPTDITGATLTSTDANCASYAGEYVSAVTDVSNSNPFDGELSITATSTSCSLVSNQIPNHDISVDATFANETGAVDGTFVITANPQVNAAPTALDFQVNAVMLNGVIWEAFPAACFDAGPNPLGREAIGCGGNMLDHPWRYNIGSPDNTFRLDAYSAHSQTSGLYHYHSTPQALYEIECNGSAASPVIGFAADGFPIYGPCFTDENGTIRSAQSGYELRSGERQDVTGYTTPTTVGNVVSDDYNGQFISDYAHSDSTGDLDACNGMEVNGQYGYYVTGSYPYVLACYTGTPSNTFGPT